MSEAMQALREGMEAVKSSDLPPINPEHFNQLLDYQLQIEAEESTEVRNILNPKAKLDAAIVEAIGDYVDSTGGIVGSLSANLDCDSKDSPYTIRVEVT